MAWVPKQFALSGGVNEEDAQFTIKTGSLAFSRNFECLSGGGYKRIQGYERYDATTAPSAATYSSFPYIVGVSEPLDQEAVTGGTSGATGHISGITMLDNGTWAAGNAVGRVAITVIAGTFVAGENLLRTAGSVQLCVLDGTAQAASVDDDGYKAWIAGARNYRRSLVAACPGTGPVLGVFMIGGYLYAWRADSGAPTTQKLYKANAGWTNVALTGHIRFDTGTAEVFEGNTITGLTSAATAIVRRVAIGGGNFAGPTFASGRFAITNITGTFSAGEFLQVAGVSKCKAVATQQTTTMLVNSGVSGFVDARHQTLFDNFYGASNLRRVYGCDGANRAYEFDGTYFINVETGMTVDIPKYIETHRNHLFLAFMGGSIQNSGTGTPLVWSVRTGASELGTGDDPTGMLSNGNNTLAITGALTVHILTGTSNLDWNVRSIADDTGSVPYSGASVAGQTLFMDKAAINVLLPAPPTYQDYATQSLSRNIRKTVLAKASLTVDSIYCTTKSQYRLFFSDKTGVVGTFSGSKLMGWMFIKYAHQITCSVEGTDTTGTLRLFAGIDDGFVMELDAGTSFDGTNIESILQLPFQYYGYPDRDKMFHKLTAEVESPRQIRLYYGVDFDYGNSGQPLRLSAGVGRTSVLSDFALFGELFWNSGVLSLPETNIDGLGRSIGIAIYHVDAVDDPFTMSALLLQFTPVGVKR